MQSLKDPTEHCDQNTPNKQGSMWSIGVFFKRVLVDHIKHTPVFEITAKNVAN